MKSIISIAIASAVFFLMESPPAMAYVGPGLGLGAIGAILGILFSILLAVFAVFWYPIKRRLGIGKKTKPKADQDQKAER